MVVMKTTKKVTKKEEKINQIAQMLEEGVANTYTSDNYKKMLETYSKFYNYSYANCILIGMQCPTASYVAGFHKWNDEFHRTIKKGSKAIQILAPCYKNQIEKDEDGNDTITKKLAYFKTVNVFDISQTEGEDLPTVCKRLQGNEVNDKLLQKIKSISPVPIEYEHIDNDTLGGYFSVSEKKIVINTNGTSKLHQVKTLLHEITHSILHNEEDGEQKDATRNDMEIQAESVAYVVSNYLGIDTSDYSFGYVVSWSGNKNKEQLKNNLEVIKKTSKQIIDSLEKIKIA